METKVVFLFQCESSHACQSLAPLVETKTKKNSFKIIIGFIFTSPLFLATKVAISFVYYSPKTIKCSQKPKIEKTFTGIDQSSERVPFSTSYLQLALAHAHNSRVKKEEPGAVCEAVSSILHWNEQLRLTDTGSSYCLFQKKVNCFANMSYQVHVIGLVMVPTLYQLAQLRVAFAKISWRAERWRSASTWFGCMLSSLGSMKRMIPFNKRHLLRKESAPFFNAPQLRVLSQNLPNKCQSLPNDAQSNTDTVIRNDPRSNCFVSCWFLVHCYQTSLLTTLLPDNIRTAFES